MAQSPARTIGKTPAMAFVLDYLREFPGADYHRVKAAAQAAGLGVPAPVIYGNALRVLKTESARAAGEPDATAAGRRRRRKAGAASVQNLGGLVEQMQSVLADRDRLFDAVTRIRAVIDGARRR
jgi:hypothetical protein